MPTTNAIDEAFEAFQAYGCEPPTPLVLLGQDVWVQVLSGLTDAEVVAAAHAWMQIRREWPSVGMLRHVVLGIEPTSILLSVAT